MAKPYEMQRFQCLRLLNGVQGERWYGGFFFLSSFVFLELIAINECVNLTALIAILIIKLDAKDMK